MAHQRSLFTNFKPIQPGKRWISGIGQSHVEILGTGDIIITSPVKKAHQTITLLCALYAPNLQINLVSVGSIAAKGGEILFTHSRVNVVRNGVLLLTGERVGENLYRINILPHTRDATPHLVVESLSALTKSLPNSMQEWHQRLAHLNYQTFIKMARSDAVVGLNLPTEIQPPMESYHDCAAGKMKRCSFDLSSTSKSSRIGQLISCNVWGPAQVPSIGGALYCSTHRDDCSDYRAAYFLKNTSEVAASVKDFFSLLHTQTRELVECIRTDGERNTARMNLKRGSGRKESDTKQPSVIHQSKMDSPRGITALYLKASEHSSPPTRHCPLLFGQKPPTTRFTF
jgi:hypothetical protein